MLMVGLAFLILSRWLMTVERRFMIIPMLCVPIFVILVLWFLLQMVATLMLHTPTAISIFVFLSMVQLMAVFIFIFNDTSAPEIYTLSLHDALPIYSIHDHFSYAVFCLCLE